VVEAQIVGEANARRQSIRQRCRNGFNAAMAAVKRQICRYIPERSHPMAAATETLPPDLNTQIREATTALEAATVTLNAAQSRVDRLNSTIEKADIAFHAMKELFISDEDGLAEFVDGAPNGRFGEQISRTERHRIAASAAQLGLPNAKASLETAESNVKTLTRR
jgi:hypothetical protein